MSLIYVFIGGGLGSLARYSVAKLLQPYESYFPWATLIANFLACVVLGAAIAYAARYSEMSSSVKYFLMTGFCGGFSTFSTFSSETFFLFQEGKTLMAMWNILGSITICFVGIYIGVKLITTIAH